RTRVAARPASTGGGFRSTGGGYALTRGPRPHPVLPRLTRVRRTGRESRGRVERDRAHRGDGRGREKPVRRPGRRPAHLLQAERGPVSGARRDPLGTLLTRSQRR